MTDPASIVRAELFLAIGAVHRLAWHGADPAGDRRRAHAWLLAELPAIAGDDPGLATILDWWQAAATNEPAGPFAWNVDRQVGGATGDVLRRILDAGDGLQALRRPARFRDVLVELKSASDRNPGKISADKAILNDAMDECKRVIRAAHDGEPLPDGLRLATLDPQGAEHWASEGPVARRVEPGTPVWYSLVKQLLHRADCVQQAARLWPARERREPIVLPSGWEAAVRAAVVGEADLAVALVQDALPEPPHRPAFDPEPVRRALQAGPGRDRRLGLALAREAWIGQDDRPAWLVAASDECDRLERELASRDYAGDAATWLHDARQELTALNLDGAARALAEADAEHRRAAQGAELDRRVHRARVQADDLVALGHSVPTLAGDETAWVQAVQAAWGEARAQLVRQVEGVEAELWLFERHQTFEVARRALDEGRVVDAHTAVRAERERLQEVRRRDDRRLGPDLAALRDRAARLADRAGLLAAIERASARRQAKLGVAVDEIDELGALVSALERNDTTLAIVCAEEAHARPQRVAYVLGGVQARGEETRAVGARIRGLRVGGKLPNDAVARVTSWGEGVGRAEAASGVGTVFLTDGDEVAGPYRLRDGALAPADAWCAVATLAEARFAELFGWIALDPGRALVPQPPTLAELLAVGATATDRLDDEALAEWLAQAVVGAPPAEAVRRWLAAQDPELPAEIARARVARMGAVLARLEAFEAERSGAIAAYLASDDGRAAIAAATERAVLERLAAVQEEVERRRVDLESSLAAARAELQDLRGRVRDEEAVAAERREAAQAELVSLEELVADRKVRLLVELGLGGRAPEVAAPAASPSTPLRASGFEATDTPDLVRLVTEIAGDAWDGAEVANLLLSMVTGRWTLLAGLPGVGKSTFARSVLARLGHGPGTERYLELVVRRDWQDDAALFGFWHPTERAWTPSSEGFVEHLLRARDDQRLGHDGIWSVLVEELNLASPEYYLARPISAFEASTPEIRLYDPTVEPANAQRYPASFAVPDSVRIVATVNVDDTVERLSPRFLSRASVIWMQPKAGAVWRPEDDRGPHRVRWSALRAAADRAETELGGVGEVVRFLQEHRIPGAPTVRTQRAIARYLGASRGVLPASDAEDLQILQRVLPPVRGTGPRWRGLLDRLSELLAKHGWWRSAERTRDLRERGEELGDWYDFFHA